MCCTWLAENTGRKNDAKKSPSGHHRTTLSGYIFATKACIDNQKKTCPGDIVLDRVPAPPKRGTASSFLDHVYCGQTAGWMKTPRGTEVDLSPGHIVLDGDPASLLWKGHGSPPFFSAHVCSGHGHGRPSLLLLSSCKLLPWGIISPCLWHRSWQWVDWFKEETISTVWWHGMSLTEPQQERWFTLADPAMYT